MIADFTVNPWGFTGALAVLTAWSLALFLHRSAVRDRVTRLFFAVLVVEGLVLVTASAGLVMLFELDVSWSYYSAHHIADGAMFVLYPVFLAHALPQRFLKPLRSRVAIPVLCVIVAPALALPAFSDFWLMYLMLGVMFLSAFALAVHAVFVARTTLARRRALLFATAFGIRDVAWGFVYTTAFLGWFRADGGGAILAVEQLYAGSTLVHLPLATYGILSVPLINIQVEVRRGVERGTLAAAFVALFFLISEGSASFLSDQFGSVAGLLGATLIVFLLSPLHRATEWLSDRVVTVDESAEYKVYRKLQMYAAAVEDALSHGEIGVSQRGLLDRLRESLEVSEIDARRIEADLVGAVRFRGRSLID